ncbi:MAG: hypothetical protein II453_19320 [Alphaproteobacteria bacterium]|nr:hypothetical protein [Alphaproteobacteria bacterium]MBQ3946565.1 hypothetical protein [Alphaproteobacteria bacterium]
MPNYVTKIRMRKGRIVSYNPLDIEGLYIGETYHTTQDVYFMLKKIEQEESEEKIFLANSDKYLIPVIALNGKVYVRSYPNTQFVDAILDLPRE